MPQLSPTRSHASPPPPRAAWRLRSGWAPCWSCWRTRPGQGRSPRWRCCWSSRQRWADAAAPPALCAELLCLLAVHQPPSADKFPSSCMLIACCQLLMPSSCAAATGGTEQSCSATAHACKPCQCSAPCTHHATHDCPLPRSLTACWQLRRMLWRQKRRRQHQMLAMRQTILKKRRQQQRQMRLQQPTRVPA